MVRKWANTINNSLDLHNYLGDISGLHGFPSKLTLLMWRGGKNTDVCLCAVVGAQLQTIFTNLLVPRHPNKSTKSFVEVKPQISIWCCHFKPPIRAPSSSGTANESSCRDNVYLAWPGTGSFSRSTSHSNIKSLKRAVTNKTIHTLKCLFLAPSLQRENCFMSFCGVTLVYLKNLGKVQFSICL